MSLFQRPIRPPAILSDEAVLRYLEAVRAELTVDPLYRRRLRGAVMNRFVAEREGVGKASATSRRSMGSLGRAVLYATFTLAVGVSTTMAASQASVPGDALYALKLRIETLRLEALPAHLHDDLAAHALGERIYELGQLADRGDWAQVAAHAAAVEASYVAFVAASEADDASVGRHLVVLDGLLDRLPASAQLAIEEVLDGIESARGSSADGASGPRGGGPPGTPSADGGQGGGSTGTTDGDEPKADATPKPAKSPKPTRTPRPSHSPPAHQNSER